MIHSERLYDNHMKTIAIRRGTTTSSGTPIVKRERKCLAAQLLDDKRMMDELKILFR